MARFITLSFTHTPEAAPTVDVFVRRYFPETRASKGCRGIEAYRDSSNPCRVTFIEEWDSVADYEVYLAERKASGVFNQLLELLDSPPSIQFWDHIPTAGRAAAA